MHKFLLIFVLVFSLCAAALYATTPKARNVDFDYKVRIENIPEGASELKIWLPRIPQTPYQEVEVVRINPEGVAQASDDKTYHNKILFYSLKSPDSFVEIGVNYRIRRYEYSNKTPAKINGEPQLDKDMAKYLISNRLMIVSPEIKEMANNITAGKNTTIEKARAIYDYVLENVSYDKTIPGWGAGDTKRVCLVKAGNCTDFHSLFVSLARACNIPAKFVMGVSIPEEYEGEIRSYHCWAEFYDERIGWVPVDISEAWKDKSKKEYFFGNLNEDRVEISQGRDIVLEPSSNSEPLNYFFYPYVEVDGKDFENVAMSLRFKSRPF